MDRESTEMINMGVMLAFTAAIISIIIIVFVTIRNFGNHALETGYDTHAAQQAAGLRSFSGYDKGKIPSAAVYAVLVQEYAHVARVEITSEGVSRYYAPDNDGVWREWYRDLSIAYGSYKTFDEMYKPLKDPSNPGKYIINDPSHAMFNQEAGTLEGKVFVSVQYERMKDLYIVRCSDEPFVY